MEGTIPFSEDVSLRWQLEEKILQLDIVPLTEDHELRQFELVTGPWGSLPRVLLLWHRPSDATAGLASSSSQPSPAQLWVHPTLKMLSVVATDSTEITQLPAYRLLAMLKLKKKKKIILKEIFILSLVCFHCLKWDFFFPLQFSWDQRQVRIEHFEILSSIVVSWKHFVRKSLRVCFTEVWISVLPLIWILTQNTP